VVDETDRWEMDLYLAPFAPKGNCMADVTLRRLQQLEHDPGMVYRWTLEEGGAIKAQGAAKADGDGLITLPYLPFTKTARRLIVERAPEISLEADAHALFAREDGTIHLALDATQANAHFDYIILGSISGTTPGFSLPGGETLPLNWDLFTELVILLRNSPALVNFHGVLDGDGRAAAQLNTLGPLPGTATGAVLHFAFALYNQWHFVSNPVGIEVLQ
jgi:hypothetical protein